jgi:hypothetical protein
MNEPTGDQETCVRNLLTHLLEIIQLPFDPEEVRPRSRSRVGLSVEEREAKRAYKLLKEEKMKEIHEFRQNYKGPTYSPVERCLWGPYMQEL